MRLVLSMLAVIQILSGLSVSAAGLPDTQENRTIQAKRYLEATPPRDLLKDVAKQLAATMPAEQGAEMEALIIEHFDRTR